MRSHELWFELQGSAESTARLVVEALHIVEIAEVGMSFGQVGPHHYDAFIELCRSRIVAGLLRRFSIAIEFRKG